MKKWTFRPDQYGFGGEGENYVLDCEWEKGSNPAAIFGFDVDMTSGGISLRIADMRSKKAYNLSKLSYKVELVDTGYRIAAADERERFVFFCRRTDGTRHGLRAFREGVELEHSARPVPKYRL